MGNSDAASPTKSDKASSPAKQEQPTIHPYSDWATMQAYYGHGVTMPPYLTAAVPPGHAPHPYMWGPQPFMTPYGNPYTTIYTHGVYSHPSVPLGSHSPGQGIAPHTGTNEATEMATPLSIEPPSKSSSKNGKALLKKLKGLDGLPISNDNSNAENTSGGGLSQSGESGAGGSSDGSDGNNERGENKIQRRVSEASLTSGKGSKTAIPENTMHGVETNEISIVTENVTLKPMGSAPSPSSMAGTEGRVSDNGEVKSARVPQTTSTTMPIDLWMQDERVLKREKRKQSNRESAKRSRIRKQTEAEDLALKVETLGVENTTLRTEIMRLREDSENLRLENSTLMEKRKVADFSQAVEVSSDKLETRCTPSVATENMSSVRNPGGLFGVDENQERNAHGSSSGKLHRLMGPNSRTDAMVAG